MAINRESQGLDATGLAALARRKEIAPAELVESTISRITRINPSVNAVVTEAYEQGLAAAEYGLLQGPFCGMPFLLEDTFAAHGGLGMTSGLAFLLDYVPDHDSSASHPPRPEGRGRNYRKLI